MGVGVGVGVWVCVCVRVYVCVRVCVSVGERKDGLCESDVATVGWMPMVRRWRARGACWRVFEGNHAHNYHEMAKYSGDFARGGC